MRLKLQMRNLEMLKVQTNNFDKICASLQEENKFIRNVLENCTSAVALLYDTVGDFLIRYCRHTGRVLDKEDREDVLSSVFIKLIYKNNEDECLLHKILKDKKARLYTYTYNLINYEILALFNKQGHNIKNFSGDLFFGGYFYPFMFSLVYIDDYSFNVFFLEKYILSKRQSEVCRLFFYEDLSNKTIARRLGISERAVTTYRQRALKNIRQAIWCENTREKNK